MANETIRTALRINNIALWQLADLLGVSEATITRMMRHDLPPEEHARIISLINREAQRDE